MAETAPYYGPEGFWKSAESALKDEDEYVAICEKARKILGDSKQAKDALKRLEKSQDFVLRRKWVVPHNLLFNVIEDVLLGGDGTGVQLEDRSPEEWKDEQDRLEQQASQLRRELQNLEKEFLDSVGWVEQWEAGAGEAKASADLLRQTLFAAKELGVTDEDMELLPKGEFTFDDLGREARDLEQAIEEQKRKIAEVEERICQEDARAAALKKEAEDLAARRKRQDQNKPDYLREQLQSLEHHMSQAETIYSSRVQHFEPNRRLITRVTIANTTTLENEHFTLTMALHPQGSAVRVISVSVEPPSVDPRILDSIVALDWDPKVVETQVVEWLAMAVHVREELALFMECYDGISWDPATFQLTATPRSGSQVAMLLRPDPRWKWCYTIAFHSAAGLSDDDVEKMKAMWGDKPSLDQTFRFLNLPSK